MSEKNERNDERPAQGGPPPPAAEQADGTAGERDAQDASGTRPPLELRIAPLEGRDSFKYEDVADK